MTTSALTNLRAPSMTQAPEKAGKHSPGLSLRGLLDVVACALEMNRAVPDSGLISPKQVQRLAEIARTI